MKITNITIKNCRGIKSLEIDNDIFSNKPNILVAPNGFGKTSIAHAFSSIIGHTKIDLSNEDRYNNNKENKAEINLSVENDERSITSLKVNENNYSNEIKKEFDVFVVSNAQKIKIRKQIFGKVFNATGHMTIEPIVICQKVKKVSIPISSAKLKKDLNVDDDIFFPIETLFTNKIFASLCICSLDILKQLNTESIYNQMENILNKVRLSTSLQDQAQTIEGIHDMISTCSNFSEAFKLIKKAFKATDIKTFILISTLLKMYRSNQIELTNYFKYQRYIFYKIKLESLITSINSSKYKNARVVETKDRLQVEIPDPIYISNGQRDVLQLVCFLYQAQLQLEKQNSIIIIDELFDYLDDANLTVAQFYISQLIEDFKASGRNLFPILLTHLNPAFFKNYVFSKQNVIYLNKANQTVTPTMQKLINIRENELVKNDISKYLLHFSPDEFDFQEKLSKIQDMRATWGKKGVFDDFLGEEFKKYIANEPYDPLAICAYTRNKIEENTYNLLHTEQEIFLDTNTTGEKLKKALETGVEIPESYFLLRIIYDEAMHSSTSKNNLSAIEAKLSNPIIKQMIIDAVNTVQGEK